MSETTRDTECEFFFADDLPGEKAGDVIGRYTLREELGHGGFGTVWRADQEEPVKRSVALKIVNAGMDTRQVVARFEQERQALAMMDHPHVARVLDAGATANGRPYFVMDLVRGEPIAAYCDRNRLSIEERLELFGQVCNAVQHAHSKGIIHRDLKPSNILVSTPDKKPHATVIDFGIAKATSASLTGSPLLTAQHQVIGTLHYMSPEQAAGSPDIDTRTDVYALGAVLYELLTGSPPLDRSTLDHAMFAEVQRLIREVDPPVPSERITESPDSLVTLAEIRRVEPRKFRSIIRGELDWIVMKALDKDRARRYETADGLAMDLRRYLAGEPLVAAPPSTVYRLRKFVRRNRGAVAAAVAIAAALMAGVIGFAWQATVAATERDVARSAQRAEERERVRAETNERLAGAINRFLLDMLSAADLRRLGREAKVAQVVDDAARLVGTAFPGRPAVEAAVRRILGKTYISLGMLDEAAPHVGRGLELARDAYGTESPEYARLLSSRADLARQRSDFEASLDDTVRALDIAERSAGPDDELTLGFRSDHANTLVLLERFEEAEEEFRATLAALERNGRGETREAIVVLNSLAVLLHKRSRLEEAEALYAKSLEIAERNLGPVHPDTLTARMNVCSMMLSRNHAAEAEPLMTEAYAAIREAFGPKHPKTGEAAGVLAGLYSAQGRIRDSVPLYEECLTIRCATEGTTTRAVGEAKHQLAAALTHMGERERSLALYREARVIVQATAGADAPDTLDCEKDLANALVNADRSSEAEPLFRDLLERCPRVLGEDHECTSIVVNSYAVMLLRQDRYAEAEPYLRRAIGIASRVLGPDHKNSLIPRQNLVAVQRRLGRLDEALALGADNLERFARVFGPRHANLAVVHGGQGETLAALGRRGEARREFETAIAISKEALGSDNPAHTGYALQLGDLLADEGQAAEAEPLLRNAVDLRVKTPGQSPRRISDAKTRLGRCLVLLERFGEAEALLLAAEEALAAAGPDALADLARAERELAQLYSTWNAAEPEPERAAKAAAWQAKAASRTARESPPGARPGSRK